MADCWSCGKVLEEFPGGRVPFRASCDHCGADLHCCQNCVHYRKGLPNDCVVPGTDYVSDRRKNNFCEEFKLLGQAPLPKDPSVKKRFDDLFS